MVVTEQVNNRRNEFENSEFYQKLELGTWESLEEALDLLAHNKVDVNLCSTVEDTRGWTYLHYIVDRYDFTDNITNLQPSGVFNPE